MDRTFKEYRNIRELTRKLAVALIERIDVYEGKRIHILFRFQMEYDSARMLAGSALQPGESSGQNSPQDKGDFNESAYSFVTESPNTALHQENRFVPNGTAPRREAL